MKYLIKSKKSGRYLEFERFFNSWETKAKTFRRKKDALRYANRELKTVDFEIVKG